MSNMAHVVEGEASESDSEIEIEIGRSPDLEESRNKKPFVIAGEAPESDDETKLNSPTSYSELDLPLNTAIITKAASKSTIYNSILHQKLWECNISLRGKLESLAKSTTDISVEKLTAADKTLLKVQECMRVTNANLSVARARLQQIHGVLDNANCGAALATVKIK